VAALSQALNYWDNFRRHQESKEDQTTGPDAAEIENLASNLQTASQGANTNAANKDLSFLFDVEGKQHISGVVNEEQHLGQAGRGFCAAVSLNDGEYS